MGNFHGNMECRLDTAASFSFAVGSVPDSANSQEHNLAATKFKQVASKRKRTNRPAPVETPCVYLSERLDNGSIYEFLARRQHLGLTLVSLS